MGEFEKHEPREFQLTDDNVQDWLRDNRSIVNHEVVTAVEKYIYDRSEKPICALVLKVNEPEFGEVIIQISVTGTEIEGTLESINEWAVEREEYEMCQRIKNLNEYIEENELQFTTESDV